MQWYVKYFIAAAEECQYACFWTIPPKHAKASVSFRLYRPWETRKGGGKKTEQKKSLQPFKGIPVEDGMPQLLKNIHSHTKSLLS